MSQRRSMPTHLLLILSALTLAAVACSLISLPFGGSGGEVNSLPAGTEPTAAPAQPTPPPPTPTQSAGSGGALPVASGACANNLLPLEVGNQWTYVQLTGMETEQLSEGEPTPTPEFSFSWTVVEVGESWATIEMTSEDLPVVATYTVECEDGAILTFPTMSLNLSLPGGGGGTADLGYEHASGVFLPSMQTLEENNWNQMWQVEIVVSGNVTSTLPDGQSFEMTLEEAPWTMIWSTVGEGPSAFERVEVRAGVFEEALPLNQESDMAFNMTFEGGSFETQFTSTSTQWYAPGVGLIKSRTEESSMNMSGIDMPASEEGATSRLELAEFRQGVDTSTE